MGLNLFLVNGSIAKHYLIIRTIILNANGIILFV